MGSSLRHDSLLSSPRHGAVTGIALSLIIGILLHLSLPLVLGLSINS
jgi:hypothetical protein